MNFDLIRVAPLSRHVRSRDGLIYMERAMKIMGWIPPQNRWRWIYLLWTTVTTTLMIVYLPFGFLGSYIVEIKGFTPGEFLTSLQVGFNAAGSSFKSGITMAGIRRFNKAKKLLDELDNRCVSDEERMHIHRLVARCNLAFLIYQALYNFYAGSTFLSGLIGGHLPWKLYVPLFDSQAGQRNFLMASFFEYVVVQGAVQQDQITDVYPVLYSLILRGHIELLRRRIKRLRSDPSNSKEKHFKDLVDCITNHKMILECCNHLRPVISGTIFIQFLLIGLVLGLAFINLIFFANLASAIATGLFIMALFAQTFPFCYICNMIEDDCAKLSLAIFQSNWVDADRRYKSTLIYFLHNVQQPIIFIAGGVFIICMNTNITVAKLAFSVVTIVKQMNIADKFA